MSLTVTTPGAGPLPRHRGEGGGEVGPHHVHRLHHSHGQDRTIVVCCCIKCFPCIDSFKKITVCKKIFYVLPKNISALRGGLRVHRADLAAAELADGGGGGAAHPLPVDGAGGRRPHAPHLDGHTQGKQTYLSIYVSMYLSEDI